MHQAQRQLVHSQRAAREMLASTRVHPDITATPIRLKLYITLKQGNSDDAYKKMLLMIEDSFKVMDLKRRIEREFAELFPGEPPYVVAKVED